MRRKGCMDANKGLTVFQNRREPRMSDSLLEFVANSIDSVSSALAKAKASDREWTRQIKLGLMDVAEKHEYEIYASGLPGAAGGEWLYDVSMMRYSAENGIEELALALESEWQQSDWEIANDFSKLVVSRADARAFICPAKNPERAKQVFDKLQHLAKQFPSSVSGDQYLISCWIESEVKFEHLRFAV